MNVGLFIRDVDVVHHAHGIESEIGFAGLEIQALDINIDHGIFEGFDGILPIESGFRRLRLLEYILVQQVIDIV